MVVSSEGLVLVDKVGMFQYSNTFKVAPLSKAELVQFCQRSILRYSLMIIIQ